MPYTTNLTLLEKIAEGDDISWNRFSDIYSPLIRMCGKDWGLTGEECDELVQEVLVSFFKASRTFRYEKSKGKFRNYLRTIVRNHTFRLLKKRTGEVAEEPPAGDHFLDFAFEEKWDTEWHSYLFSEALFLLRQEMEPLAFETFYLYVIKEESPAKVATKLGISVNAVYIHKSRALDLLRRTIKKLEEL